MDGICFNDIKSYDQGMFEWARKSIFFKITKNRHIFLFVQAMAISSNWKN